MRLDLTVKYQCGCTEDIRTEIKSPEELTHGERDEETDRKIIDYIVENYRVERWRCPKGHGFGIPDGFEKIVSINN